MQYVVYPPTLFYSFYQDTTCVNILKRNIIPIFSFSKATIHKQILIVHLLPQFTFATLCLISELQHEPHFRNQVQKECKIASKCTFARFVQQSNYAILVITLNDLRDLGIDLSQLNIKLTCHYTSGPLYQFTCDLQHFKWECDL